MKRLFEMLALASVLAVACQRVPDVPVQPREEPAAVAEVSAPQVQQVNLYLEDGLVQQVEAALEETKKEDE